MKTHKIAITILITAATMITIAARAQSVTVTNIVITTNVVNLIPELPINPTISGGLGQIAQAAFESTNFAVTIGGGRGLHGNHNLLFADYLYNFMNNGTSTAGLLLGFDEIAPGFNFTQNGVNFVKGGLNISTKIAPFTGLGWTNIVLHPFASVLIDTGNGQVGEIVVGGADWGVQLSKNWALHIGGIYENRTGGDTTTDGAYLGGFFALSRNWWFGQ